MRKLTKKEKIIKKTLQYVLGCGVLFGILMAAGGVGNLQMLDEMHETYSRAEEIKSYVISACGPLVSFLCYHIGAVFNVWDEEDLRH